MSDISVPRELPPLPDLNENPHAHLNWHATHEGPASMYSDSEGNWICDLCEKRRQALAWFDRDLAREEALREEGRQEIYTWLRDLHNNSGEREFVRLIEDNVFD